MPHAFRFERFEVRPAERQLLVDGMPTAIGARAFDVLLCLLANAERVVGKNELIDSAWPGLVVEENNLSVQVSALRKVLGANAIATVAGRGYQWAVPLLPGTPAAAAKATPDAPTTTHTRPTIAVLPFSVLSDDPQLGFLADGLAEDVIALLARVPGFTLISRASSFAFRGQSVSLPEIARQLGVRFVVEGSVRSKGDVLRFSTQLTEATTGHVLWSGAFERPRHTAQELQEAIARGILSELEPQLTRAEMAHIRRQRLENPSVWAHYHQAIGAIALQGWGRDAVAEARKHLQGSVSLDPSFGLGHAHYALLTALSINLGLLPGQADAKADALTAANRAMALDDGSSEVLGYSGCALCDLGEHARGIEVLQRALDIDPSNAQAHVALGAGLVLSGQLGPGIERMRIGMAISPRDRRLAFWGWALGTFLLRAGRLEEALQEARTANRNDPRFHLSRLLEAVLLDRQSNADGAQAALATARRLYPALSLDEVALTHGRRASERMALLWRQTEP